MNIYLASPFFNETELCYVSRAEEILRARGFDVFSPREHEIRDESAGTPAWALKTFRHDIEAIDACDVVVMLYHGNYSDSGTAFECGYAYAIKKPTVVVQLGENSNLMIHADAAANITMDELPTYDFSSLPKVIYTGSMF